MPDNSGAKILQVGGVWLPKIRKYNITLEDIDSEDSNRSESGIMNRNTIRKKVYHASVQHMCRDSEMERICAAVIDNDTVSVVAYAPGKSSEASPYAEFTAYVSKLDSQLIWYETPSGEYESWWQIDYQLVEV